MRIGLLTLYLLAYCLFVVAGLYKFQKPKINVNWILNYLPLLLTTLVVVLSHFNWIDMYVPPTKLAAVFKLAGPILGGVSIVLYSISIYAHRHPVQMWHQSPLPDVLTYRYTYKYIRHPIYTAYICFFIGAVFAYPGIYMLIIMLYGTTILNMTASEEEKQLTAKFGDEYRAYMKITGRFLPCIACR